MGLSRPAIKLLAETVRASHLAGRALIIGKQDVWGTHDEVARWLCESGLNLPNCETAVSVKPEFRRLDFIQDTSLFKLMGFQEVVTLDNSPYEGAEMIHDLNIPLTEDRLAKIGQYDVIIDSGCLEHVFDVPQVLRNFFRLANDRGVVIHIAPSSNLVDHGFYMFSPTFFQDYYSANRWQILCHYFFQNFPSYNASWRVYEYEPNALAPLSFGGLKGGMYGVYIAAQKKPGSTCDANVQQGTYLAAWSAGTVSSPPARWLPTKGRWLAWRERLKPLVPKSFIPLLMTIEAKLKAFGGVGRYLKHYKNL